MNDMNKPVVPTPTYGWGDKGDGGDANKWDGWMTNHSRSFNDGVNDLKALLDTAFTELAAKPSSPELLATYQSALSEYNMYRMLQSNSTKSLTDQSKSVIRNLA